MSVFQPAFGFNRSHAARSRRRDRLTENGILYIAACENARNVGPCGIGLSDDVSTIIKIDLTFENIRIRIVADRNEQSHPA